MVYISLSINMALLNAQLKHSEIYIRKYCNNFYDPLMLTMVMAAGAAVLVSNDSDGMGHKCGEIIH